MSPSSRSVDRVIHPFLMIPSPCLPLVASAPRLPADAQNGLYVSKLQWWTTDQQLEDLFGPFGRLRQVRIYSDKANGKSKGFAFIEFDSVPHAAAALAQLNGVQVNGKPMQIEFSNANRVRQIDMQTGSSRGKPPQRDGPQGGGAMGPGGSMPMGGMPMNGFGGAGPQNFAPPPFANRGRGAVGPPNVMMANRAGGRGGALGPPLPGGRGGMPMGRGGGYNGPAHINPNFTPVGPGPMNEDGGGGLRGPPPANFLGRGAPGRMPPNAPRPLPGEMWLRAVFGVHLDFARVRLRKLPRYRSCSIIMRALRSRVSRPRLRPASHDAWPRLLPSWPSGSVGCTDGHASWCSYGLPAAGTRHVSRSGRNASALSRGRWVRVALPRVSRLALSGFLVVWGSTEFLFVVVP